MASLPETTDVLICGCGPAGLTAALSLRHHDPNLKITLVEARSGGTTESRALVIHAATLEALDGIGCAEPLMNAGYKAPILHMQSSEGPLMQLRFGALKDETKYPCIFIIPQNHTETVLTKQLQQRGILLHLDHKLTELQPLENESGFKVGFENGKTIKARYIVGADGGRSSVRTLAGIGWKDVSPGWNPIIRYISNLELFIVVADVHFDRTLPKGINDGTRLTLGDDGFMLFVPLYDHIREPGETKDMTYYYRVAFFVSEKEETAARNIQNDHQIVQKRINNGLRYFDLEGKESITRENVPLVKKVTWTSTFTIRFRKAEKHYKHYSNGGNIVLVGDASHIHSPAGGQGMNLGINDAVEAGAAIVKQMKVQSRDDVSVLEAFEKRRDKISEKVIKETKLMTWVGSITNPWGAWLRNWFIWLIGRSAKAQRNAAYNGSGLRFFRDPYFLS